MPIGGSGTTISLGTLRGEFGGATPDSLSEYYANKAYSARGVMSGQRGYPSGVETAIPGSGQISFSNFHASRILTPKSLGFSGTYYASTNTFQTSQAAFAGIIIEQDGGSSVNLEGDVNTYVTTATWLTAKELASIGNSFWVRFTLGANSNGGSSGSSGAIDPSTGWLQLSTFRGRFIQALSGTSGIFNSRTVTATYAIDIASDSGGTNIVSSSSINLEAFSQREN